MERFLRNGGLGMKYTDNRNRSGNENHTTHSKWLVNKLKMLNETRSKTFNQAKEEN